MKKCIDHEGNEFDSQASMYRYWNINRRKFQWRIKHGYSLEEALTNSSHQVVNNTNKIKDHEGTEFNSTEEMCKHWNVPKRTYYERINAGLSIEEALTRQGKHVPHKGKEITVCGEYYNSFAELSREYNIPTNILYGRFKRGDRDKRLVRPIQK